MNKNWLSEKNDPAVTRACLVGTEGEYRGQVIELSDRTKWGRHPQNDVCLSDATVSTFHMQIRQVDAGYEVVDLGSKNGTKLNGRWVRQPVILADQDIITVGNNTFCVKLLRHGCEEHASEKSTGSPSSEPNPDVREHGGDTPREEPQGVLQARFRPVVVPPNREPCIAAAKVPSGDKLRPPARNSEGCKTSRNMACLAFCALQVFIVVLVLWPMTERFAGNTDDEPGGQTASTLAMSLQGESGGTAPLQQMPEEQEPQLPGERVSALDANIPSREMPGQADHLRDTSSADQSRQ